MPTKRQLWQNWASEFEYFRGQDPRTYQPKGPVSMTGEVIGTIQINPATGDLRIIPTPPSSTEEDSQPINP